MFLPVVNTALLRRAVSRALRQVPMADALRGGIVCTVPALLAVMLHAPLLSWSAIAAFWTCFADPGGRLRSRLIFALWFGLAGALASGLGSYSGAWPLLAAAATAAVAFACAFARGGAPRIGLPALLVATAFGVSTAFPGHDTAHAMQYAAYFLLGNLWALGFGVLLWRGDAHAPVRRALAACFAEMADLASELSRCTEPPHTDGVPPADARAAIRVRVRTKLETVGDMAAIDAQGRAWERSFAVPATELAAAAEEAFIALVGLDHLLAPDAMAGMPHRTRALISRLLSEAAESMTRIALYCKSARPVLRNDMALGLVRLDAAIDRLQATASGLVAVPPARLDAATLAAVFSRIRSTVARLQTMLWPRADIGRSIAPSDGGTRSSRHGLTMRLAANLHGDSIWFRYALRVALASAIAVGAVQYFSPDHGYWLILTMFFTMQPNFASTLKVSVQRIGGTLLGVGLAALLGYFVHSPLLLALLVFPLSIGTLAGREIGYVAYTLFLTPHFILVAELAQPGRSEPALALMRMSNTLLGAALAVAISFLVWPQWERNRTAHVIATAVEASARYVAEALRAATGADVQLAQLRRNACLAIDHAEVSLAHMRVEPQAGARWVMDDRRMIAALRDAVGAATLFEMSVATPGLLSAADRMGAFAVWVDDEMRRSAAWLRGSVSLADRCGKRAPLLADGEMTTPMGNALQRISSAIHAVREIAMGMDSRAIGPSHSRRQLHRM
jgi:uncharacterized membrane protein YccC